MTGPNRPEDEKMKLLVNKKDDSETRALHRMVITLCYRYTISWDVQRVGNVNNVNVI
jgi:hypothetical protein